ncbi:CotH kinase family protein [Streptococcus merionis]|uniref:CotH protein n=1 Tax=Streptococcus merionis TaxID=400065 RepID=A0A239SLX4_9STRE|nr:CotH kinase family protein [Streptococcus merionis]SNU86435.1 CotH protein [Streptococcus merionis]
MKHKVIYLITCLTLIVVGAVLVRFEPRHQDFRKHHHRQKPFPQRNVADITTHLPVIAIETESPIPLVQSSGSTVAIQDKVEGKVKLYDTKASKPRESSKALIGYRGNSSWHFDKKSLKLHFVTDKGKDRSVAVAGMAEHSEWVLHGPFLDRSLLRNYIGYNISGEIMDYAPNVRYCELVVNGEYQGLYLAVENIEQGSNRIRIEKSDKRSPQTSYIVEWGRKHKANNLLDNYVQSIHQAGKSGLDVKYPGPNRLTPEQKQFIERDISQIERTLYSYDLKQYPQYLDREAFADYFIINEFFRNTDAGKFSTYFYKDLRDKMKPVVWDFNNALDNQMDVNYDAAGFTMVDVPWFNQLLKDEAFVNLIVLKYRKLRESVFSTEYLHRYIDETVAFLGPAIERNYDKWGYVFRLEHPDSQNYLMPYERNVTSYQESLEQLKDFIRQRGRWLDKHIDTLYQYSSPSKNVNTLVE